MITVSDECTSAMASAADPGSDNTPARDTSPGGNLPAAGPSAESTPASAPGVASIVAEVTRPGDNLPASWSSTDLTPSMTPNNPASNEIASGAGSSASHSNAEPTTIPPNEDRAVVPFNKANSREDDADEASGSYSDYLTWTNRKLKKILKEVKREATQQFLDALSKLLGKTKVILVVGQAGTGKTSLLKSLTGSADLKPAGTMSSGTRRYEIHTAIVNHEQFLFVDTAGFGAADIEDEDNFRNIEACLTALGPFATLVGVIFVYGCPDRYSKIDEKTIQWLQCFCGPDFYGNITVVTTKWDTFSPGAFATQWAKIEELKGVLSSLLDPEGRRDGAILYHHGLQDGQGPSDTSIAHSRVLSEAFEADERAQCLRTHVEKHYCNTYPEPIQFLKELQEGKKRMETEAGKVLTHSAFGKDVIVTGDRAVVVEKTPRTHDDEGDKVSSPPPREKTNPTSGHSDEKAKAPEKVKAPEKPSSQKAKGDTKPPGSESEWRFGEDVGRWLRLLYDVAQGFRGVRTQRGMGTEPNPSLASSSTWGSWFFSWFTGPPKNGQN